MSILAGFKMLAIFRNLLFPEILYCHIASYIRRVLGKLYGRDARKQPPQSFPQFAGMMEQLPPLPPGFMEACFNGSILGATAVRITSSI